MYIIKLVAAVSILGMATASAFAEATAAPASAPSSVAGAPSETQVNDRRIFRLSKQWREKKVPLDKSNKDDELYWIRLKTVGNGMWEIESASHLSLEPRNNKEEVLLVSPRRKLYHPNWGVLKGEGNAPVSLVCTDKQVAATTPYWTCNSAFATLTTADAIVSFFVNTNANNTSKELRSLYSFSEDNLAKAVMQIDLDGAMRAAEVEGGKYQQRMAAQRESFRQSDLREKERSQLQRQADDVTKKQREDALYVRVAKYPAGFRDVCQMPDAYTGVETTPPQDPKLVCQNMGEVPSLARLKNAGFIVTNTNKVRSAVDELGPYTRIEYTAWQYNVERFNLPR